MKNSIIILLALLSSTISFAGIVPEITINNSSYPLNTLCFEQGFLRPIEWRGIDEKVPVLSITNLLIGQRTFHKVDLIPSKHRYYDRIEKKYKNIQIQECSDSIFNKALNSFEKTRKASTYESLFYGNLLNHGLSATTLESWKKHQNLEDYVHQEYAKSDRIYMVAISNLDQTKELVNYQSWKDTDQMSLGGERSGGGGGSKIGVNFRIDAEQMRRMSENGSALSRFLNMRSTYESVVDYERPLPKISMDVYKKD